MKNPNMEIQDYRSLLNDDASRHFETYSYLAEMDATEIRRQIQSMLDKGWDVAIEHVELETMPDFFEVFVEGCQIKPMELPDPSPSGPVPKGRGLG